MIPCLNRYIIFTFCTIGFQRLTVCKDVYMLLLVSYKLVAFINSERTDKYTGED